MSSIAFVLGNGESRKGIKISDMQKHGKVYAAMESIEQRRQTT